MAILVPVYAHCCWQSSLRSAFRSLVEPGDSPDTDTPNFTHTACPSRVTEHADKNFHPQERVQIMSKDQSTQPFEFGFAVSNEPDNCRPWYAGRKGGRSFVEVLEQDHHFTSLGEECYRLYFIGASEKFPESPAILEEDKSTMVKQPGRRLHGTIKTRRTHDSRGMRALGDEIGDEAFELYLEYARLRIHSKHVPSFQDEHCVRHGAFKGRVMRVDCHAITQCPPSMRGAYVRVTLWGHNKAECKRWLLENGPELFDRFQMRVEDRSIEQILRDQTPFFPWTHGKKRRK